jgi:hypothetical protein
VLCCSSGLSSRKVLAFLIRVGKSSRSLGQPGIGVRGGFLGLGARGDIMDQFRVKENAKRRYFLL